MLIVFDDMITDMINTEKLKPIITELFIGGKTLNIWIVFITQSYFKVPKDVILDVIPKDVILHIFYYVNSK